MLLLLNFRTRCNKIEEEQKKVEEGLDMKKRIIIIALSAAAALLIAFGGTELYKAGYSAGLYEGHTGWYNKGYEEGSEDGYARGLEDGAAAADALSTAGVTKSEYESAESMDEYAESAAGREEAPTQEQNEHESEPQQETHAGEYSFVLNKSSKKFHKPDCKSVSKMNDENREYYSGTRDELIAKGYKPCGSCNP